MPKGSRLLHKNLRRLFVYPLLGTLVGCTAPLEPEAEAPEFGVTRDAISSDNVGGSNIGGANVAGGNVGGTNLGGANLGGTNVSGTNVAGNNVGGTNLGGNNVGGNNLAGTNVAGANVAGNNVAGTNVSGSNVSATNISGTNLGGSNVAGANVSGNNVAGSNLASATLSTANVAINIHNGTATGLLNSGEDLWSSRTSSCVVLGIGSTAFAKVLQANPTGTMYTAIKQLPWGFTSSAASGTQVLNAWEAVVWGSSKYCTFIIAAPPGSTFTGIAGYVKAVWRWNAPPSRTMQIGQIGGGQTIQTHTGMMDTAAKVLAGTITDKYYAAGLLVFAGATTNDVSVQVDFASWIGKASSGNDPIILGTVAGMPSRGDGVYRAILKPDGKVIAVLTGRSWDAAAYPMFGVSGDVSIYRNPNGTTLGTVVPKRCILAQELTAINPVIYPLSPTKCDSFSIQAFNDSRTVPWYTIGGTPFNSDVTNPNNVLFSETPDGVANYYMRVGVGSFCGGAKDPAWDPNGYCKYPIIAETYVNMNETPYSVVNGEGGFLKITPGNTRKITSGSAFSVTVTVTNIGSVPASGWTVKTTDATFFTNQTPAAATGHNVPPLAPGASVDLTFSGTLDPEIASDMKYIYLNFALYNSATDRYSTDGLTIYPSISWADFSDIPKFGSSWSWTYPGRGLGDFQDTIHTTTTNGDYAQYTFTGIAVALYAEKNAQSGNILVSVDGAAATTVSLNNATQTIKSLVYNKTGLAAGVKHTIKITKSTGTTMNLDALKITNF